MFGQLHIFLVQTGELAMNAARHSSDGDTPGMGLIMFG